MAGFSRDRRCKQYSVSEALFASVQDRVQGVELSEPEGASSNPVLKRYLPVFKIDLSGLELSLS
jgi:hypothetical protein